MLRFVYFLKGVPEQCHSGTDSLWERLRNRGVAIPEVGECKSAVERKHMKKLYLLS